MENETLEPPELDRLAGLSPGIDTQREVGDDVMRSLFGRTLKDERRFGRYQVVRRLGRGAMGTVYLARDPDLDREVAIKVLHSALAETERATLVVEAKAMARLSHPHVVAVYDVGEHEGQIYVAMERVDGVTLREWATQATRSWSEVAAIYRDVARGLAAAHAAGVVHRDFKPDNVMVEASGRVAVVDFGLAQFETSTPPTQTDPTPPASPRVAGTPAYMAPEVIRNVANAPASDQFSFGVALHEALCGQRPYVAEVVTELLARIVTGEREPRPAHVRVPPPLWAVVERTLRLESGERYASMIEVADALEHSLVPWHRRLRTPVLAVGLLGSAVAGAYGYQQLQRSQCEQEVARIEAVWTPEVRTAVHEALSSSALPYASFTAEGVDTHLQRWTEQWGRGRAEACASRGSDHWAARRRACSDGQLVRLEGLLGVLSGAESDVVARALDAAQSLPSPAQCADDQWLSTGVLPPPDAEIAEAVAEVRQQLARVSSLYDTGQYAEGMTLARAQHERAVELGYRPLIAEATFYLGRLHDAHAEFEVAREHLFEVFTIATEIDAPELAVRASVHLAEIFGARLSRSVEGRMWAELPVGYLERLGDGARTLGILRRKLLARLHADLGDVTTGLSMIQAARADAEAFLAPWSPVLTSLMGEESLMLADLGRFEASIAIGHRAVDRARTRLGPDHPSLEPLLTNLMIGLARSGQLYEARPIAIRIVDLNIALHGLEHPATAEAQGNLANVLASTGEVERALALGTQAHERLRDQLGPRHRSTTNVQSSLSTFEGMRADPLVMLRFHDDVLATLEQSGLRDGSSYSKALRLRADTLDVLGRFDESREALEHAERLESATPAP